MAPRTIASLILAVLFLSQPAASRPIGDGPAAEKANADAILTLLDAGAEPRRALRFTPAKGDQSRTQMMLRMAMRQNFAGMEMPETKLPAMRMVSDLEVTDVAENGDVTYVLRYVEGDVADEPGVMPMVRRQMAMMMESMKGLTMMAVASNRGFARSFDMDLPDQPDPMIVQQLEDMRSSMQQFTSPVPEEPVGVGAKWQVRSTITQAGMSFNQTTTFTLKSIDEGMVTLDVDLVQDADPQDVKAPGMPPGATLRLESLKGSGSGTTRVRLTDIMPSQAELTTTNDTVMSLMMGDEPRPMRQNMRMSMSLEAMPPKARDAEDTKE